MGKASANPAAESIRIRGARVHNLKNVSLDIPRDNLVVLTGVSGSGKSSLAFDTIFAEGQRQYIEGLSTYARQFLNQLERPDADLIEGLQPTIAIDQRAGGHNPRSTVATVTEVYDYLRLLMARCGDASCPHCGEPIRQQSPQQILDALLALPEGTKAMLLAPLVRGRKGAHPEVLEKVRKAGFQRVRVDGVVHDVEATPELAPQKSHDIEAVIDRVIVKAQARSRLAESLQLAIKQGEGAVIVTYQTTGDAWTDKLFSTENACPRCQQSYEELEPRSFSFNSPYGACHTCEGLGGRIEFDPELVLPDASLSLAAGAIAPWRAAAVAKKHRDELAAFAASTGVKPQTPLADWKPRDVERLLRGDGRDWPGLLALLNQEYEATADEPADREMLDAFRGFVPCADCGGARLRAEARAVRIAGRAIHELTALSVDAAGEAFQAMTFAAEVEPIARPLVAEIVKRLQFLAKVGLTYLTLDRAADSLSGGEAQRIKLAAGIGSALVGVCYVLDEPSIGLHPRDNDRLIGAFRDLQRAGNTLLVVEHDEALMREADHLIDLGPGAGQHGGQIVAQGTPAEVAADAASLTGRYLSAQLSIAVPSQRRPMNAKRTIVLEGATAHNLQDVTLRVPLGLLVCVTGVSGSGKSTLVNETLAPALARKLTGAGPKPAPHGALRGANQIDKLVVIDQSPIGRTPRSNPATYTGVFDEIRKIYATTREARLRGYKPGRFSFNSKGGRCETCQGQGVRTLEMNFLPDLHVVCPDCNGARFNRQTLEIRYKGRNIAELLDMRIDEAAEFLASFPAMARTLASLRDVGLGYLSLGQSSTTLSGGEAQRIKLAADLGRPDTGNTLYVLDEPTTGLHFDDVRNLLLVLNRLVDLGNTVLVIEHNLEVIKTADWLIDLGPEGGAAGGQIIAAGPPEEVATHPTSHTGRYLNPLLAPRKTASP